MKIIVNGKEREISVETLALLIEELALSRQGVAIAVDNRMVPRTEWDTYRLSDGANVVIIKAACGG